MHYRNSGVRMNTKKILVPTDFSHTGDTALEYAASLAKEQGARLLIVHVQELPKVYAGDMYYGIAEPSSEEVMSMLRDVKPTDGQVPVEYRLLSGEPAEAVVRLSDEEDVDMIVVGSHGRTGFSRALLGSVAEAIVRKAHCPVVVCKQRIPKHAATASTASSPSTAASTNGTV